MSFREMVLGVARGTERAGKRALGAEEVWVGGETPLHGPCTPGTELQMSKALLRSHLLPSLSQPRDQGARIQHKHRLFWAFELFGSPK